MLPIVFLNFRKVQFALNFPNHNSLSFQMFSARVSYFSGCYQKGNNGQQARRRNNAGDWTNSNRYSYILRSTSSQHCTKQSSRAKLASGFLNFNSNIVILEFKGIECDCSNEWPMPIAKWRFSRFLPAWRFLRNRRGWWGRYGSNRGIGVGAEC